MSMDWFEFRDWWRENVKPVLSWLVGLMMIGVAFAAFDAFGRGMLENRSAEFSVHATIVGVYLYRR